MKSLSLLMVMLMLRIYSYSQDTANLFKDERDSHLYQTVSFGSQTWMAENLAYLPMVYKSKTGSESKKYYYVYGYEGVDVDSAIRTDNYRTYGVLYNWVAAQDACPGGWHLPTDLEWKTLTGYLKKNGYGYVGKGGDIGKSIVSRSGWTTNSTPGTIGNDQAGNNKSGFSILPAGFRTCQEIGEGGFDFLGYAATFWSATEHKSYGAWSMLFVSEADRPIRQHVIALDVGFSVRCLRNQ